MNGHEFVRISHFKLNEDRFGLQLPLFEKHLDKLFGNYTVYSTSTNWVASKFFRFNRFPNTVHTCVSENERRPDVQEDIHLKMVLTLNYPNCGFHSIYQANPYEILISNFLADNSRFFSFRYLALHLFGIVSLG